MRKLFSLEAFAALSAKIMLAVLVHPQPLARSKCSVAEVAEVMPRLQVGNKHTPTFKVRLAAT